MKKIAAVIGICLVASLAQGQQTSGVDSTPSVKTHKHQDAPETLAEINAALAKRQAEEQEATSKGRTDIATAIQKIITDLNNMKTALGKNDTAAFKTANEQRKQDHEALEALRKADGQGKKHEKASN